MGSCSRERCALLVATLRTTSPPPLQATPAGDPCYSHCPLGVGVGAWPGLLW